LKSRTRSSSFNFQAVFIPAYLWFNYLMLINFASIIFVLLVAILHLGFLTLEMFLWIKPFGRRTFNLTTEFAQASKTLAANQGLYNGFLAAGLIWSLFLGANGYEVKIFFLLCVIVAGVFGAFTVSRRILWIQALPAVIALIFVFLSK